MTDTHSHGKWGRDCHNNVVSQNVCDPSLEENVLCWLWGGGGGLDYDTYLLYWQVFP